MGGVLPGLGGWVLMLLSREVVKQFLRRKWVRWFLGVGAVFLVAFVGTAVLIWTSAGRSSEARADAAIVLGAAVWGEEPSPVFEGRLDEAVRLVASGMVDQVILTGGVGATGGSSEAEVGKRYLVSQGVPGSMVIQEDRSRRTFDNLKNAKELMEREGWRAAWLLVIRSICIGRWGWLGNWVWMLMRGRHRARLIEVWVRG